MRNAALVCDNFTIIDEVGGPQECINQCQKSLNCQGFTFKAGTCKLDHEMGKYKAEPGSISGRRCSECVPLELSLVQGLTLDKRSGVSLESCQELCNTKPGCSHYNFYYSKIPADTWSRCVLLSPRNSPERVNKNFVLSGERCRARQGQREEEPQRVERVTREVGMSVVGSDLKSYSNISSVDLCIDICHKTERCEAYQHVGGSGGSGWEGNICHVKYKVTGLKKAESDDIVSGYSYYVCNVTTLKHNEAIGQNLRAVKSADPSECVEVCLQTVDCVGFSFSHKHRLCFVKSSLEQFKEREGFTSGSACYRPPTYSNFDLNSATSQVGG